MRKQIFAVMCVAMAGALALSGSATAQQKTAKACQEEWRANKAANQAAGITEKAYVAQCRAGASPTTQAPAAPSATAPEKTAKACQEEWRANKAANQAAGITEKAYVAQCRAGASPTTQAPAAPSATAPEKTAKACQEEWRANKAAN